MHLIIAATHVLERGEQASGTKLKCSSPRKLLTNWRAKDKCHEQGLNDAAHQSHSLAGGPMTGIVNRVQIQLNTEATHFLESRGQVMSAGSKSSSPQRPLTFWKYEDRCCQQGQKAAHHGRHSLAGEPRTASMSRDQMQFTTGTTHLLESQGQMSRDQMQLTRETTHILEK